MMPSLLKILSGSKGAVFVHHAHGPRTVPVAAPVRAWRLGDSIAGAARPCLEGSKARLECTGALGHTDMRKGLDGLATLIQERLKKDPFPGHLFVFRGKNGDLATLRRVGD